MPKLIKAYKGPFETPPRIYMGLDPGLGGGIAAINNVTGEIVLFPLSTTDHAIWDAVQTACGLAEGNDIEIKACLEWINPAIQGIAKSGMSKLYGSYKALGMALVAAQISHEVVQPKKWQTAMGCPLRAKSDSSDKWKKKLLNHAKNLYPKQKGLSLATGDALLMATYYMRLHQGA